MTNEELNNYKATCKMHIAEGELVQAFTQLREHLSVNSDKYAPFSAQEVNYYLNETHRLQGVVREEDFQITQQQTALALIQLIEALELEDLND